MNKFENFKEQYDDMMKWTTKKVGQVLQEQDNLDLDELYGMATVATKKAYDLSNAAMELVEWQCEVISKLQTAEEEAVKERDVLRRYLANMDTKLNRITDELMNVSMRLSQKVEKKDK